MFPQMMIYCVVLTMQEYTDLVVRFCKDVETRSQTGYIDFGRFNSPKSFHTGSGQVDFVQDFYNSDLVNGENSYDKLGRTAQVNILCGGCSNGACKGILGCICNFTYESTCMSSFSALKFNILKK
ncbi:unnamed protein product [Linum trigynum]|uniref:Uncharacterized protein n=1 Tax=Linum trigynum TaxID=586398 RepID=A0AAV2F8W8_9ROSI